MQNTDEITPWEEVTIANKYMFYKVMTSNTDLCRRFIEHLLHIEIARIEPPSGEHVMDPAQGSHGIRLDVYVKDTGKIYDLEMQIADTKNLPERARYYQGVMDETELKPSEEYDMLKTSYVMFLCLFDLFGKGLPVYTFQNRCDEDPGIYLDDRAYKIFYNITGWEQLLDEEEKAIFRFILDGQARSSFTRDLKSQVQIAQMSPQARQGYMTWERLQAEAQRLGMERGIVEGERLPHSNPKTP